MKIVRAAFLAALSLTAVEAFQPRISSPTGIVSAQRSFGQVSLAAASTADAEASPCAGPNEVIPDTVTAQSLRAAVLTNVDGQLVRLDEKMGTGTSIVVFLRHLG